MVGQINSGNLALFFGIMILLLGGFIVFVYFAIQFFVAAAFNSYMMYAAAEKWGWFGPNIYDRIFKLIFDQVDEFFLLGIFYWPIKEFQDIFLYYN